MSSVSVIVPAYNAERTIRRCVESALRQSRAPLEVIVVDDGSSDGTAAIAESLDGVRLIRQANAGPASARNHGIKEARGEWIAFLDSDEEWPDIDKLSGQLACADRFGAVLVGARGKGRPSSVVGLSRCLLGNPFTTSGVLASKASVLACGGFEEGRFHSEDFALWLEILAAGGKAALAGVDGGLDISGRSAYSPGGLSGNLAAMQRGEMANFRRLYRRGALARRGFFNFPAYFLAISISSVKYIRRHIIIATRRLGRRR